MENVLWQVEYLAFIDTVADDATVLQRVNEDMSVQLIEDLVPRVDVEIVSRVRSFDDLEYEVRSFENLTVSNRTKCGRKVLFRPFLKAKGLRYLHEILLLVEI